MWKTSADTHFSMDNNVNYYILFPAIKQTFLLVVQDCHWVCPKVLAWRGLSQLPDRLGTMLDSRWAMCYTVTWVRRGVHEKMLQANTSNSETTTPKSFQPMGFTDILDTTFSITAVIDIFTTPILPIGVTLLYFDQRIRKEAFDIEMMMAKEAM